MALKLPLALCLTLVLQFSHSALANTQGQTLSGYTFASDVSAYVQISKDVCDITAAVDVGDYATAQSIYASGKNVEGKTLRSWANSTAFATEDIGAVFNEFYANQSSINATWLDVYITAALENTGRWTTDAGRGQAIKKAVQGAVQGMYVLHELEEAITKVEAGNIEPLKGAPHNVDEAWGIYAGDGAPTCNMLSVPEKRNTAFGTSVNGTCTSQITTAMTSAFNAARNAAIGGDATSLATSRDEIAKQFIITYLQATIYYADKLSAATDFSAGVTEGHQSEGYTFFWTIAPWIASVNSTAADTVFELLEKPETGMVTTVVTALESTYEGLGIEAAEVGKLGATQPDLVCSTSSALKSGLSLVVLALSVILHLI